MQKPTSLSSWSSGASERELDHVLLIGTAILSMGAAAIHFGVSTEHFQEYAPFGVFFAVVGWLQIAWAWFIVSRPRRWLVVAGASGNLLVVIIWLISRTSGLPLASDAGVPESADFIDVLSTLFETLIVVVSCIWLRSGLRRKNAKRKALAACAGLLAFVVMASTSYALARPSEHGSEDCAGARRSLMTPQAGRLGNQGIVVPRAIPPLSL